MKKTLFRILSVFVLLSIIAGSIPTQTTAVEDVPLTADTEISTETTPQMNTETTQPLRAESAEEPQAVVVREDIALRDEFVKHFQMSDGSYTAAVYNEPIHQLVDGAWVEVDNSLTLSTSAKGAAQYKTVNGLTDVSFAQSFRNELVTMEQDNHSITWGVQAVVDPTKTAAISSAQLSGNLSEPAQAQILSGDLSEISAQEQKVFATKSASVVRYSDALTNDVDLEYTVLPSRVKESIILGSPQSISAYTVTVNTSDLSARLLDNREVEFYTEDGEAVFTMWAPYMYDSASELSEDIGVELTPLGNGQYAITLTPDAGWLNSPDRVYPIVIDPDVAPSRVRTNIIDNTVMEGAGNQNSNLDRLYIGKKSGSTVRAYMKYSVMPAIPSDATITAATQTVYITAGTSTANTALACVVTGGDWSSDTITWANRPTAATQIHPSINHNNCSYYTFSCLSAVQGWYSGSTIGKNRNYGIVLRYTSEIINDYNSFYSGDYSVESRRPQLTISYQIATEYITITEGETYKLTPPDIPGTISWESGKTSVVTVDSQGNITGGNLGSATVYASSGGEIQKLFIVHVIIPNGVYYIKSNQHFYLGTAGWVGSETRAKLYSQATSGIAQLRQLWKITYLGADYYTIRPLHKLDMLLYAPTANTIIGQDNSPDTFQTIQNSHRWTITNDTNGGYILKLDGSDSMALKPADPGSYPGLNAMVCPYSQGSASFSWSFLRLTTPLSGILIYETSTGKVLNNTTYTVDYASSLPYSNLGITTSVYGGDVTNQTVNWVSLSPDVLLVAETTGNITATRPGSATLVARSGGKTGTFTLRAASDVTLLALHSQTTQYYDNRMVYMSNTAAAFRGKGSLVYTETFENMQPTRAIQHLKNTSVFFTHNHGLKNALVLENNQYLTSDALRNTDLSNLRLAVLLCCYTGEGGYTSAHITNNQPVNFLEQMVCSGVETVIGFNNELGVETGNDFAEDLAQLLTSTGCSVEDAVNELTKDSYSYIKNMIVIGGNQDLTLY